MNEQLDWLAGGSPPFEVGEQHLEPIPLDKDRLTRPEELVVPGGKFRVTNNYVVDSSTMSQMLRAVQQGGPDATLEEITSHASVPYEVIRGYLNVGKLMQLVEAKGLTPLAKVFLKFDPHFLNAQALWFLHYVIASDPHAIIWSRVFNSIFSVTETLKSNEIDTYFQDCKANWSNKTFTKNGGGELLRVLSAYSDGIFKSLGLVMRYEKGEYTVITDVFDIPPVIWLASILAYRERYYPGAATLETHLITEAHFSPGRLFRQNEKTVRAALDALHNLGLLTVERNLGLDQVRFKDGVTWLGAVARHLQEGR